MAPPVVEVTDAPRGLVELKIRDSRGTRIGFFQVASSDLDEELVSDLHAWQARHAHRQLSVIRGSSSSSA